MSLRPGSLPQSSANPMLSLASQQYPPSAAQPSNLMAQPNNVNQTMGMLHQSGMPNGSMPSTPSSVAAAAAAAQQRQGYPQLTLQQVQAHQQHQQQQQQRAMMMRAGQPMGAAVGVGMGGGAGAGNVGGVGNGTAGGVGVGVVGGGGGAGMGVSQAGGPPQLGVGTGLSQQSLMAFGAPGMMPGQPGIGAGGPNVSVRRVSSQPHPTNGSMSMSPQQQQALMNPRHAQQQQLQNAALRLQQPHPPPNTEAFLMGMRPPSSQAQILGGGGGATGVGGAGPAGAGGAHPHPSQQNPFQHPHSSLVQPSSQPQHQHQHQPGSINVPGPSQANGMPGRSTPDTNPMMSFRDPLLQTSIGQSFTFNTTPSSAGPTPDRAMSHPSNITGGYMTTPLQQQDGGGVGGMGPGAGPGQGGPTGMTDQQRFESHFGGMTPGVNTGPPRPPSMAPPGPTATTRMHSPHQHSSPQPPLGTENMYPPPPRPQSVSRAPTSQDVGGGTSRTTPRMGQTQLPNQPPRVVGGVVTPGSGGMQPGSAPQQPPPPATHAMVQGVGGVGMMPGGMRPPVPSMQATSATSSTASTSDTMSSNDPNMPMGRPMPGQPPQPHSEAYPIGDGQGLIKLLNFSGVISSEAPGKFQLSWWEMIVNEFFTRKSSFRFTLWKDNEQTEAKPFEIGVPVLPRFFLITTQAGVKSMSLTLDGARERIWSPGHSVVECVTAAWTWRYTNGHSVTLRGPLTCHLILCPVPPTTVPQYVIKIDQLQFDATSHEKHISLDAISGPRVQLSPSLHENQIGAGGSSLEDERRWEEPRVTIERANMPGEPVNAFGIPQATMRCLELAESVSAMSDLIAYSTESNLGPRDALEKFAASLKERNLLAISHHPSNAQQHLAQQMSHSVNGIYNPINPMDQSISLYTPLTQTSNAVTPSSSSPQMQSIPASGGGGPGTDSPTKQAKTMPSSAQQTPALGTASIPATPTASAATPPATSIAAGAGGSAGTHKRKQAEPTETSNSKRPTRRRKGTGT